MVVRGGRRRGPAVGRAGAAVRPRVAGAHRWALRHPVGAVVLAIALVYLLLGIAKGTEWGWSSSSTLGSLGVAAVLLAMWGRFELRRRSPLVDLRVSARPAVLWTNIATVLLGFSIFATFSMSTQVLQAPVETGFGHGLSMLSAGLLLLPIGGSMVAFSSVSAWISRTRGPRTTVALGAGLLVLGNAGIATLPSSIALLVGSATVGAVGAALAYSVLPLLIMRGVPLTDTAAANSLNMLMRQLGTSTVTAVGAALGSALVVDVDGAAVAAAPAYTLTFAAAAAAAFGALAIALLTSGLRGRAAAHG